MWVERTSDERGVRIEAHSRPVKHVGRGRAGGGGSGG